MSEPGASETERDRESQAEIIEEAEILDGLPVLAGTPRILPADPAGAALPPERRAPAVIPAVQAAAVAAGGFVAGAAVVGLVHRRRRRSTALVRGRRGARALKGAARREGRAGELLQIVGSRSLLVDLHLLGGAGTDS